MLVGTNFNRHLIILLFICLNVVQCRADRPQDSNALENPQDYWYLDFSLNAEDWSSGFDHTCMKVKRRLGNQISSESYGVCFGRNTHGQVHQTQVPWEWRYSLQPTYGYLAMPGMTSQENEPIEHIAAGGSHTCRVLESSKDTLECYGNGSNGQLGPDANVDGNSIGLGKQQFDENIVKIATGRNFSCALVGTDSLNCFGSIEFAHQFAEMNLTNLVAGDAHACVLTQSSRVFCVGQGSSGQIGNGLFVHAARPEEAKLNNSALSIYAGSNHTCTISASKEVECWGAASEGQLGSNFKSAQASPIQIQGNNWELLSLGESHTCGLYDGNMKCFGSNAYGQLGTEISNKYKLIVAGRQFTCGIIDHKNAECFGRADHGRLGKYVEFPSQLVSPVRIPRKPSAPYEYIFFEP